MTTFASGEVLEDLELPFLLTSPLRCESEKEDDPAAYLIGICELFGVSFHVEAIAVHFDKEGLQCADDPNFESTLDGLSIVSGSWDPMATVTLFNREYVICITPFTS